MTSRCADASRAANTKGHGHRVPSSLRPPLTRPGSPELPGYAPDARVLIINADDFGIYHEAGPGY